MAADEDALRTEIDAELSRIEESAMWSSQGHFEAAKIWSSRSFLLTLVTAAVSTVSAVLTFSHVSPVVPGTLAVIAAILAATSATLRPDQKAAKSENIAQDYLDLQGDARRERHLAPKSSDLTVPTKHVHDLANRQSRMNHAGGTIPRRAYHRAARNITSDGGQDYAVDAPKPQELEG